MVRSALRRSSAALGLGGLLSLAGCDALDGLPFTERRLVINEVMSNNDGAHLGPRGEADDYIELVNVSARPVDLSYYTLSDQSRVTARLPEHWLGPGEAILLFADGSPEQGALHLPFKLSAAGDSVSLRSALTEVDALHIPPLEPNHAYARLPHARGAPAICSRPTPGRPNGERCGAQSGPSPAAGRGAR